MPGKDPFSVKALAGDKEIPPTALTENRANVKATNRQTDLNQILNLLPIAWPYTLPSGYLSQYREAFERLDEGHPQSQEHDS